MLHAYLRIHSFVNSRIEGERVTNQARSHTFPMGVRIRSRRRRYRRGGVWEGGVPSIGKGLGENFGTFSLEMAHFGANSVVF